MVCTSHFLKKTLLLKSMGKLFPHPVGVFRTIPNPPQSRIMQQIDLFRKLILGAQRQRRQPLNITATNVPRELHVTKQLSCCLWCAGTDAERLSNPMSRLWVDRVRAV